MSEDSDLSVARSLGHHGHWGLSAGFDILEALETFGAFQCIDDTNSEVKPINILLVQPGDIRHILFTISRRRRHKDRKDRLPPINFYLFETPVEILAREVLLLEVLNDYEMPIRQRANTFLEIFGNCKVQRRTANYIDRISKDLLRYCAKGEGRLDSVLDLTLLNHRELDSFETALRGFSFSVPFDIHTLLDHRWRGFYAERFDNRVGLYDWDYQSLVKPKASIIHSKQFKEWRNSGIAFEFGDQRYTEPNRTMMTFTEGFMKKGKDKGMKKEIKGYWGDIVCSPYFAIGIDSDVPNKFAEGLYDILNKNTGTEQHRHHAVEIALYNMYSIMWEIEHGAVYTMRKGNDIYSGLGQYDRKVLKDSEQDSAEFVGGAEEEDSGESGKVIIEPTEESDHNDSNANASEKMSDSHSTAAAESKDSDTTPPPALASAAVASEAVVPPPPPTSQGAAQQSSEAESIAGRSAEREAAIISALRKAETIVEIYAGVKVIPLTGTLSTNLKKSKLHGNFDAIFVSSRAAQALSDENFKKLPRQSESDTEASSAYRCLLAVETAKFLVPLHKDVRVELEKKEIELAEQAGFKKIAAPVYRRKRDENDRDEDVIFFQC